MEYPSTFQVMEPSAFLGQPMRGIVGVLFSFEDEHYSSNSRNPWCLIIEYFNEGICFFVDFGGATQYPSTCQKIHYGAQCIFFIPIEG